MCSGLSVHLLLRSPCSQEGTVNCPYQRHYQKGEERARKGPVALWRVRDLFTPDKIHSSISIRPNSEVCKSIRDHLPGASPELPDLNKKLLCPCRSIRARGGHISAGL